jgi:hypothetical protein
MSFFVEAKLNSERAIEVNIEIMRAFVQIREMAISQGLLSGKIREIEARLEDHDESIDDIFEAILYLINPPEKSKKNKLVLRLKNRCGASTNSNDTGAYWRGSDNRTRKEEVRSPATSRQMEKQ